MMKPTQASRREYAQRLNRVLDYIDRHLDQPLDLTALAEVAHFSPFHFHRLFASWLGQTLGDYIRGRRLDVGALWLAHRPGKPVLDIALDVGFGSTEAFARAFKQRFGMTPSAWRRATPERWAAELAARRAEWQDSNPDQLNSKRDQLASTVFGDDAHSQHMEFIVDVTLETLRPVRVAYMRHIGPYGPSISRFWHETFLPWRAANGLTDADCYGIGHDDPAITPAERCRCDTCVEVPADFVVSPPASETHLPGGRYAVAKFKGRGADIGVAWGELLRQWLPSSGLQVDSRPFFEWYDANTREDPATGEIQCKLCIPVRSL